MSIRVNAENFQNEVLRAEGIVLADFYSDSCVPCKRMSPILAEIEESYSEHFKLAKININFDSELAEQYEVQTVPSLLFFRNGEVKSRLAGAVKKAEIIEIIENL